MKLLRLIPLLLISLGVAFLISSCGTRLGEIRPEEVNLSIADARKAIEEARRFGAEEYARDGLMRAETLLAQAQDAFARKEGLKAIDLAYRAMAEAKAAGLASWRLQRQREETESILKAKEAELRQMREQLRQAQREMESTRSEMRALSERVAQLEREREKELDEAWRIRQEAERKVERAYEEVDRLQEQLDAFKDQLEEARLAQRQNQAEAQRIIQRLSRKMEETRSQLERARREAEAAREKVRAQAVAYSRKISKLEREKARELAIAQAREYVAEKQAQEAKSYPPPLSKEELQEARAFVESWYLYWENGDIAQHLLSYAPEAEFTKVTVKKGKERKQKLSRTQFESELRKEAEHRWTLVEKSFSDRAVVGRYTLRRERGGGKRGGVSKLVDVWVREAHVRKIGPRWKVVKEIWRFYESVPDYAVRR
jgi:DNA repair exonuclease SbcCD ATPase subunit